MKNAAAVFKSRTAREWTLERIEQMTVQDIKQLRENAERLNQTQVVAWCSEALRGGSSRTRARAGKSAARTKARRLIARTRAFEARGVWLQDRATSWGGLRKSDGAVVMALWAEGIESVDGGCRYLLWAPNVDGSRPWSDAAAGRERLDHCKQAITQGQAEGLLVYGERLSGHIPEHKAYAVDGVDPETVVLFRVEQHGTEYWAHWGKRTES